MCIRDSPCIYGAIREQMDLLDEAGIEYEVIPGVSSFIGAAASLKAEFTLPDVSQTVILTRMEGRTPVPEKERIEELARHQATMVIFLSAGMPVSYTHLEKCRCGGLCGRSFGGGGDVHLFFRTGNVKLAVRGISENPALQYARGNSIGLPASGTAWLYGGWTTDL